MNNSIQDINELPSVEEVKKISQGLALVDAIIMPEWEYRYFSFNNNWDGNSSEMMASMRDGSGGEYFINFTDHGVVGKVFFEKKIADASRSLSLVPDSFAGFKNESAFNLDCATFFFWYEKGGSAWTSSSDKLEAYPLLSFLVSGVDGYLSWAKDYYEKNIDNDVLKDVFASLTISADQLAIFNPDLTLEDLEEDIQEIL